MHQDKFRVRDIVQVHLPDKTDPDHDRYHGKRGIIVKRMESGLVTITGQEKNNSTYYRVQFSHNKKLDLPQQALTKAGQEDDMSRKDHVIA